MNKCFVGNTGVVWNKHQIQPVLSTLDNRSSTIPLSPIAITGGLLIAVGAGWYLLQYESKKRRKEREEAKRIAEVDELFSNKSLLKEMMKSVMNPSSKSTRIIKIPAIL